MELKLPMRVINLLGAPCVGKTTLAHGLCNHMKRKNYDVEFIDEFAKGKAFEKNTSALGCQPYIFGNQLYKLHIVKGVEYVVTDSPILLSSIYNKDYRGKFDEAIVEIFNMFDNVNILLTGKSDQDFKNKGRVHNKEESEAIHSQIVTLLGATKIDFISVDQYADIDYDYLIDTFIKSKET